MSIESAFFYVILIAFVVMALSCFGLTRMLGTTIANLPWKWIVRVIIGLVVGFVICCVVSKFGLTAGLIGLVIGFVLGFFILSIIAWAWKKLPWWGKLVFIVTIIAAFVAAFGTII